MKARFPLFLSLLCLAGCAGGGGGYTRSPVITPQELDCGPAGLAAVKVWSPAEADLTFHGRTYNLKRDDQTKGAYYKNGTVEYANRGAFGLIRTGGQTYHCDFRPRDLEPEVPVTIVPEVEQRVPRLDVTPYM